MGISLIKNSILLFAARVVNLAATFAIGLYIAKFSTVETFGQFSFILSYFFLFSVIFSLGLGTLITRDTAKAPEQVGEYFSNTSFVGIASGAAGFILMLFLARFFNLTEESRQALTIIGLSICPSILIFIWESLLISFEKNQYIAAIQGIEAVMKIALGYVVLSTGLGLIFLMGAFLVTRCLSGLLYYLALRKVFRPLSIIVNFSFIKKILAIVPTFAALYMFSVLFSKIDLIMLALLKNFTDVGIYSASYKLLEISFMLPTSMVAVFFPVLSRYAKESPKRFSQFSSRAAFYSTALFLPVVLLCLYFSDRIIVTIYSEQFSRSIIPFRILIITLGFYSLDQIFAHSLVAHDLQNLNLRALAAATLLNVILNIILIPRYSYIGASAATLVSMAALLLTHLYFVRKHLFRFHFLKMLGTLCAAAALPSLLLMVSNLGPAQSVLLWFVLYGSLILLIGPSLKNDREAAFTS